MLAEGKIDAEDIALLAALSGFSNALGADGWPAHATLAQCVGRSRSWVCKRLGRMGNLGLVEAIARKRDDGGRTTNAHRILFDAPIVAGKDAETGTGGNPLGDNASRPKNDDAGTGPVPSRAEQGPSSAPRRGASDSMTDEDRPTDAPAREGDAEPADASRSVDGAERPEIQIPVQLAGLHPDRLATIRADLAVATDEQRRRFADAVERQTHRARNLGRWAESMARKARRAVLDPDDEAEAARMRGKREAEEAERRECERIAEDARIEDDPIPPELFAEAMPASLAAMA